MRLPFYIRTQYSTLECNITCMLKIFNVATSIVQVVEVGGKEVGLTGEHANANPLCIKYDIMYAYAIYAMIICNLGEGVI